MTIFGNKSFFKVNLIENWTKDKGSYIKNTQIVCMEHSITSNGNHVQDINDDHFNVFEVLKLKAELIKLEIENITNIEDLEDISGEISLNDGIKNSHQESKQSHSLQSIGKLLSENENLESNCKII